MEPRELLSAVPIHIGAVYHEDADGEDHGVDTIEITWTGGAPGTTLTQLSIRTDKNGDGLYSNGDVFFDTAPGGMGVYGSAPVTIVDHTGIDQVTVSVTDGGMLLVIDFVGFHAGEKLILTCDIDELGDDLGGLLAPEETVSAVAEGAEFQGSVLRATFTAPHYYDASGSDFFLDRYDGKLNAANEQAGDHPLHLPPDRYVPPPAASREVQTAGAIFSVTQQPLPISIAGTVFEDLDLDNRQDPGEPGLAGVRLTLHQWDGTRYVATGRTTLTDQHGNYRFDDLLPGTYQIVESQPAGYLSVGARPGTVGGWTRGTVETRDVIGQIELFGGEDSVKNDFAETRPVSLSGYVYHDANNNGLKDPGEQGIGGALVRVPDRTHPPDVPLPSAPIEVYTDATGYWEVTGLYPGEYWAEEVTPAGYLDGLDAAGTAGGVAHNPGDRIDGFQLHGGDAGRQYNFGELLPNSISGRVFVDANGNGAYDAGETLLGGVTIYLLNASGQRIAQTATNARGEYEFTGLGPGTYGVEEVQPDGYYDGPESLGSEGGQLVPPDSMVGIVLVSATDAVRYDFCEWQYARLSGFVYVDDNNNGVRDPGEAPIAGVELRLLDAAGNPTGATTTTNASGFYRFDRLVPFAQYGVAETQPAGYYDGSDAAGTAGGTAHNPGDRITGVLLPPGADAREYNFGELRGASLSGFVYVDDNNNGRRDPGEAPIAGVEIRLLDAAGNPTGATAVTDASGFYRFDNLPPLLTYGVAEVQPAGYYDGLDSAGTAGGTAHNPGDRITGVLLPPGADAREYNFGELRPASISGRVFADLNGDGALGPGEPRLASVTIHLLDRFGNRIDSTTTDTNGEYIFRNLAPGTYGVEEIQPAGYFDGGDYVGSAGGVLDGNDRIVGAKLVSGTAAVEYNFCEVVPASISGYVFQDGPTIRYGFFEEPPDPFEVRDGLFTPDDTPIAGVVLRLGDATGQPILDASGRPRVAVTNARGYYEFTHLEPGDYSIFQTHPEGYVDGIDTAGSHGGVAVNSRQPGNLPALGRLTVDPNNDAIIDIRLGPGDEAVEYNFSEVRMERVPFIPPPPPPPPRPPQPDPPDPPMPPSPALRPPTQYLPSAPVFLPIYGGGGGVVLDAYTWHLSVVNAGRPRRDSDNSELASVHTRPEFITASWSETEMDRAQWVLADDQGQPVSEFQFGLEEGIPLSGDFDGDGISEVAIFLKGIWFIDLNGNGVWDEGDLWARLGSANDLPVTGDWDGDGKTDIGIFGPAWRGDARAVAVEPGLPDSDNRLTGRYKNVPPQPAEATSGWRTMRRTIQGDLRADLIDHVFQYGAAGDVPIAGDWNGDGVTNIGLFRGGVWYLDADGDGRWTEADIYIENFGAPGDLPVVGDWNGDGIDNVGFYRGGTWRLDSDGDRRLTAHDKVFELGTATDLPVVGDWNGDGIDQPGIYRPGAVRAGQPAVQTADAPAAGAPARQ